MLSWIRGKRFDPPPPPLRDYWVTIHVRLHEPHLVDGEAPADAYLRILGVRCTPQRLLSLLAESASDGSIISDEATHWHEVSLNQLSRDLRASITVTGIESVWHISGRIYFPSDGGNPAG